MPDDFDAGDLDSGFGFEDENGEMIDDSADDYDFDAADEDL